MEDVSFQDWNVLLDADFDPRVLNFLQDVIQRKKHQNPAGHPQPFIQTLDEKVKKIPRGSLSAWQAHAANFKCGRGGKKKGISMLTC